MSIKQDQIVKIISLLEKIDANLFLIATTVHDAENDNGGKVLNVDIKNQVDAWINGGNIEIED